METLEPFKPTRFVIAFIRVIHADKTPHRLEEFKSDDDEWSDKMARLSEQSGESGPGEMQSK